MLVWFRNWGIPLLSHEAAVILTDEDVEGFRWGPGVFETGFRPWIDRFVSVSVNPPGITKNVLYGSHDIREPEGVRVDKRYFFRRSEEEDKHMRELPEVVVRYPWGDRIREVIGLPGSVLDDVRSLGNLLATLYRWKQEEAVWFLLTGTTPLINPLEISASLLTGSYRSPPVWTVTLEVAPWMAVSTVSEAYREIQKQILKGDSSTSGIKQERKLAVFRFVTEQTRAHGEQPPWQELFERWNEEYPEDHEWHYKKVRYPKSRYESFQRDYRDAEKAVMRPHHDFPKRKVTTKLEEWQEEDLSRRRAAAEEDLDRIAGYLEGEEPDY